MAEVDIEDSRLRTSPCTKHLGRSHSANNQMTDMSTQSEVVDTGRESNQALFSLELTGPCLVRAGVQNVTMRRELVYIR